MTFMTAESRASSNSICENLARWLDGVYDANLLSGTNAVSTNIKGDEGYVVYVSDRRGDRVKTEYLADGTAFNSTNGNVDNEDIYGPNGRLDAGEDVIDFGWNVGGTSKKGTLQKDTLELPDAGIAAAHRPVTAPVADRMTRAENVMRYNTTYFRRAVRLFDGETFRRRARPINFPKRKASRFRRKIWSISGEITTRPASPEFRRAVRR